MLFWENLVTEHFFFPLRTALVMHDVCWGAQRFKAWDKVKSGPQKGRLATTPLPCGDHQCFRAGNKISTSPQVDRLAT